MVTDFKMYYDIYSVSNLLRCLVSHHLVIFKYELRIK